MTNNNGYGSGEIAPEPPKGDNPEKGVMGGASRTGR